MRRIQHGHPAAILRPMCVPRAIGAACFGGRHQTMAYAKRIGLEDAITYAYRRKNFVALSRRHLCARQHRHARREKPGAPDRALCQQIGSRGKCGHRTQPFTRRCRINHCGDRTAPCQNFRRHRIKQWPSTRDHHALARQHALRLQQYGCRGKANHARQRPTWKGNNPLMRAAAENQRARLNREGRAIRTQRGKAEGRIRLPFRHQRPATQTPDTTAGADIGAAGGQRGAQRIAFLPVRIRLHLKARWRRTIDLPAWCGRFLQQHNPRSAAGGFGRRRHTGRAAAQYCDIKDHAAVTCCPATTGVRQACTRRPSTRSRHCWQTPIMQKAVRGRAGSSPSPKRQWPAAISAAAKLSPGCATMGTPATVMVTGSGRATLVMRRLMRVIIGQRGRRATMASA